MDALGLSNSFDFTEGMLHCAHHLVIHIECNLFLHNLPNQVINPAQTDLCELLLSYRAQNCVFESNLLYPLLCLDADEG